MILYTLRSNIFIIRIIIIIFGNKKLNSIFDTGSKIIQFMGSNKYIIAKIKCWPVFKQDPNHNFILQDFHILVLKRETEFHYKSKQIFIKLNVTIEAVQFHLHSVQDHIPLRIT